MYAQPDGLSAVKAVLVTFSVFVKPETLYTLVADHLRIYL